MPAAGCTCSQAAAAHGCLVSDLTCVEVETFIRPSFWPQPRHADNPVCNESTQVKFPGFGGESIRGVKGIYVVRRLLRNQVMFSPWLYNATPDAPMK
ncbi:hypothetical protein LX32DRAFT_637101 [Colletotrichum zoysiae]|uniref:Uncharacterized protein n=1 Tax=Colletotrichum zoysiae TaxID=1216348 RepID=A0AAD9HPF7_9PEZI|nr:hypothetical protein LX32DRAFT_637101 [Colletotrichum zoysiae]